MQTFSPHFHTIKKIEERKTRSTYFEIECKHWTKKSSSHYTQTHSTDMLSGSLYDKFCIVVHCLAPIYKVLQLNFIVMYGHSVLASRYPVAWKITKTHLRNIRSEMLNASIFIRCILHDFILAAIYHLKSGEFAMVKRNWMDCKRPFKCGQRVESH